MIMPQHKRLDKCMYPPIIQKNIQLPAHIFFMLFAVYNDIHKLLEKQSVYIYVCFKINFIVILSVCKNHIYEDNT